MTAIALNAIAYLKGSVPRDEGRADLVVSGDDAPVLKPLGGELLVAYAIDAGQSLMYVQEKHMRAAGLSEDQLHELAVANLAKLAEGRVTLRQNGPTWAVFFEGNFEASLILLDDLWETGLAEFHDGQPVVAVPARDILCFCNASSAAGLAELRRIVGRLWPGGDHLISKRLFQRRQRVWHPFDDLS